MGASEPFNVAVVGAGPAGLAVGRALKSHGIAFEIFEKHSDVGGIWDMENPGSPMYRSAHFISSKTKSGFSGYPMPDSYPDYPSNGQILAYVRAFARDAGLAAHIHFSAEVKHAERVRSGWKLQVGKSEVRDFTHLVAAPGTNWAPSKPVIPGSLAGSVIHSVDYKSPDQFKGKRVLIVGAGNSGCDIACDAARSAAAAFISMRRGYHFVPKHIFGMPADVFASTGPKLPIWASQRIFGVMLRVIVGDLGRHGVPKPDHRLLETHPILNDQIIHHLRHGDIAIRPGVERFDGREVVFKGGDREQIDLVVLATGYNWPIPFIDRSLVKWDSERPELYLNVFAPEDDRLFVAGFLETNGGIYEALDNTADMIARAVLTERDNSAAHQKMRQLVSGKSPDISGGIRLVKTARHAHYADIDTYKMELKIFRKKLGWPQALAAVS